jgi:hypothetical protein
MIAADAGFAGVGSERLESKDERREVIMAARSAAGLRDGVERTGIEPVTSGLQSCPRWSVCAASCRPIGSESRGSSIAVR